MPTESNKYVGEFIGTFVLVFTVCLNVAAGASGYFAVLSIACSLSLMIYAIGPISGGNFNPAVTLALHHQGALNMTDAAIYAVVQCVAGACAGFCFQFMGVGSIGGVAAAPDFNFIQALIVEFVYTWMLVFVVLNTAVAKSVVQKGYQYFGIAIGFVVVAGGYGGGFISGGCFNPAIAFGVNVAGNWNGCWRAALWMVVELAAGFCAVISFHIVRPEEIDKEKENALSKIAHKVEGQLPPKLVSEFLGTYILMLTVGLNVLAGAQMKFQADQLFEQAGDNTTLQIAVLRNNAEAMNGAGNPGAVLSIGCSLMCMIFALGDVSGANFNPAVTIAILASGRKDKLEPAEGIKYIAAQVVGAIGAAFTYFFLYADKNTASFNVAPPHGNLTAALFGEMIFTFVLTYVVLCVATVNNSPLTNYFGMAIGFCVVVGGYAIGNISGGYMNPALVVGASVVGLVNGFDMNWLLYALFEVIGGGLAGAVFHFGTHAEEYSANAREVKCGVDQTCLMES